VLGRDDYNFPSEYYRYSLLKTYSYGDYIYMYPFGFSTGPIFLKYINPKTCQAPPIFSSKSSTKNNIVLFTDFWQIVDERAFVTETKVNLSYLPKERYDLYSSVKTYSKGNQVYVEPETNEEQAITEREFYYFECTSTEKIVGIIPYVLEGGEYVSSDPGKWKLISKEQFRGISPEILMEKNLTGGGDTSEYSPDTETDPTEDPDPSGTKQPAVPKTAYQWAVLNKKPSTCTFEDKIVFSWFQVNEAYDNVKVSNSEGDEEGPPDGYDYKVLGEYQVIPEANIYKFKKRDLPSSVAGKLAQEFLNMMDVDYNNLIYGVDFVIDPNC
jgi:hypothetical protein